MTKKALLSVALVLAAAPLVRAADDEQAKEVKVLLDDSARIQDRETALQNAFAIVLRTTPAPHTGALSDAVKPLLERLKTHLKDKAYEHLMVSVLKTVDIFTPYPDLGPLVRPYLTADAPRMVRRQALLAVAYNGASGIVAELEAILKEPEEKDGGRQALEQLVVDAARNTPPPECARVLGLALEISRLRAIQRVAARGLGEKRSPEGKAALQKALKAGNPDDVLCEIAQALIRHGSLEGVGVLVGKLKRRPSREVYKTICEVTFRPDGWKNVSPERFYEAQGSERNAAVAAIQEWWKAASQRSPDSLFVEAVRAAGIKVPDDLNSKDFVTSLIEALALEPPSLKYTALELLAKKTDQKDLAKDFNVLKTDANAQTSVYESEPFEGFEDANRRAKIHEQQKAKIEKWREWWKSAQAKATMVDGVWRTS